MFYNLNMNFDPQKHWRSIQLKEYDYSQPGGYFITIVAFERKCLFGKPVIGSIPTIVRTFKAAGTRRLGREFNVTNIWQRDYYEHVIRKDEDWDKIHRYIESNPSMWAEDNENPT